MMRFFPYDDDEFLHDDPLKDILENPENINDNANTILNSLPQNEPIKAVLIESKSDDQFDMFSQADQDILEENQNQTSVDSPATLPEELHVGQSNYVFRLSDDKLTYIHKPDIMDVLSHAASCRTTLQFFSINIFALSENKDAVELSVKRFIQLIEDYGSDIFKVIKPIYKLPIFSNKPETKFVDLQESDKSLPMQIYVVGKFNKKCWFHQGYSNEKLCYLYILKDTDDFDKAHEFLNYQIQKVNPDVYPFEFCSDRKGFILTFENYRKYSNEFSNLFREYSSQNIQNKHNLFATDPFINLTDPGLSNVVSSDEECKNEIKKRKYQNI